MSWPALAILGRPISERKESKSTTNRQQYSQCLLDIGERTRLSMGKVSPFQPLLIDDTLAKATT